MLFEMFLFLQMEHLDGRCLDFSGEPPRFNPLDTQNHHNWDPPEVRQKQSFRVAAKEFAKGIAKCSCWTCVEGLDNSSRSAWNMMKHIDTYCMARILFPQLEVGFRFEIMLRDGVVCPRLVQMLNFLHGALHALATSLSLPGTTSV